MLMKVTVIGTGNMGGALVRGLVRSGVLPAADITCTALSESTLGKLRSFDSGLVLTTDNVAAVRGADVVVIAVKPWVIASVVEQIASVLDATRQCVVSMVAGISLDDLAGMFEQWSGQVPPLCVAIPNTAIELKCGVSFLTMRGLSQVQSRDVTGMFAALGKCYVVDEPHLRAGTVLASCGIAYALRYIHAAAQGGVELGFRPAEAQDIVAHTVKGAAELLIANGTHAEQEIDKVTTAGGLTIRGLNAMEHAGFSSAVIKGLKA